MQLDQPRFPEYVDNTMRKELVKCQMAAHYRFEMGLREVGEVRVDLHAGKAFAKGMEAMRRVYYGGGVTEEAALAAGLNALIAEYGAFRPSATSNKTVDKMAGALAFYVSRFPLAKDELSPIVLPDGKLGIELSISYELPLDHPVTGKPLMYVGNLDMLALDKNSGKAWVVDEKTTSQMGDKWVNQWALDSQMTGYCWLGRKLLDEVGLNGVEIAGAVVNGVAIKKYDYEAMRVRAYREPWMIERWHAQLVKDVEAWIEAFETQQHNQALDHACAYYNNPCAYSRLCMSKNPERLLDGNYVVEFWKPEARS